MVQFEEKDSRDRSTTMIDSRKYNVSLPNESKSSKRSGERIVYFLLKDNEGMAVHAY